MTATTNWHKVRRWDREAERSGVRVRVFCASLADVFEDWQGPMIGPDGQTVMVAEDGHCTFGEGDRNATMDDARRDLFTLIDDTPNVNWLLLTKRPENVARMWPIVFDQEANRYGHRGAPREYYRPNVWLGTSIENQEWADKRLPHLHAAKRNGLVGTTFVSAEPLVGPVMLQGQHDGKTYNHLGEGGIDWVITGGESGPGARPVEPDWFRSLRDQCEATDTPFHFKQWGEWMPYEDGPVPLIDSQHGDSVDRHTLPDGLTDHEPVDGWWWPNGLSSTLHRRVGKKAAGRLLDGQTHDGLPRQVVLN